MKLNQKLYPHVLAAGRSCLDAYVSHNVGVTFLQGNVVAVKVPGECKPLLIDYKGDPISWGEKRTCTLPPVTEALPCLLKSAGGAYNSSLHLLRTHRRVTCYDEIHSPEAALVLAAAGGHYFPLSNTPVAANAVLRKAHERIILRHPDASARFPVAIPRLDRLGVQFDGLLINSLKNPHAARSLVLQAAMARIPLVFVANNALPAPLENWMLGSAGLAICNLSEFSAICRRFGISCPADEKSFSSRDVCRAMVALASQVKLRAVAVTCGDAGMILRGSSGLCLHVALAAGHRAEVAAVMALRAGGTNGAGDIATAACSARFISDPLLASVDQLRRFGVLASVEVLAALAPSLHPRPAWFQTDLLIPPLVRPAPILRACGSHCHA